MTLELAKLSDAIEICKLLNLAYRGAHGWTTERAYVDGNRATVADVKALLTADNTCFLIHRINNQTVGCISIEKVHHTVYMGAFAVHPEQQSSGLGSLILERAEKYAVNQFKPAHFVMVVLSVRVELIAYYERRGYMRNGQIKAYPVHLSVGTPLIPRLMTEELTKKAH